MPLDSVLTLGDFEFQGFEVPASLPFGGTQWLVTHKLPGGARTVQSMGADPRPLAWSGRFRGANAVERARFVDGMRIDGNELDLSWRDFRYLVKVASFSAEFERFYEVPYSISVEVIEDLTNRPTSIPPLGYTDLIDNDLSAAGTQADAIGDGPLASSMSALSTAIKAVSDFAKATTTQINSVLAPLADAQARVGVLIASASNAVANVTTLGGVFPNNPIAKNAARLGAQATALTTLPQLYNMQAVLGRIGGNVGQLNPAVSGKVITVGGGTLFDIAAKEYGDATKWDAIGNANGIVDPALVGIQTITVPTA